MKKISVFIFALVVSATTINTYSQDITDALRYSYITPGGTARFMSMGGSFGALGGDFSTLSINPAGIGVYRSSELSFTPSLYHNKVESSYYGDTNEDFQYNFNLHNLGGIFHFAIQGNEEVPGWRSINFGIGINRHNNFNFRRVTEGMNPNNSLLTEWRDQVRDDGYYDDFTSWLAYDTWLMDSINDDIYIDAPDGGLHTRQESDIKGYIREFELTLGANYNDQLYIGGSFGFPRVRYEETTTHQETDIEDVSHYLNSFSYKQNLRTTGTGFNFKLGAIYRATDIIRLGAAIHTPTFYDLSDEWETDVKTDLYDLFGDEERNEYSSESQLGHFNYELNTPLKAIGSIGLVFGDRGLINIDYEYIDYTNTRLRSADYPFSNENDEIRHSLQAQHNIRAGGEIRLQPLILRAGYAFYSNPYKPNINNTELQVISGGFGIREQSYSLDLAYMYSIQNEDYYPYGSDYTDPMKNDYNRNAFMITLGYRY